MNRKWGVSATLRYRQVYESMGLVRCAAGELRYMCQQIWSEQGHVRHIDRIQVRKVIGVEIEGEVDTTH
jgi:hypothetical protein